MSFQGDRFRKSRQEHVGRFLLPHLNSLKVDDRYKIESADCLVEQLKESLLKATSTFSVDVEELFYSVPHWELTAVVSEIIERSGTVTF